MSELLENINDTCDVSGGVDTWYAFTHHECDGTPNIATLTIADGICTALTLVSPKKAYAFNIRPETAFFNDAKADGAGGYGRTHTATAVLHGNTAEMIVSIEAMAKSRTTLIAKLNDGSFELLGWEKGLKCVDDRASGTAYEDMNGTTLTFSGKQTAKAVKISSTIVNALLA